MCSDWNLQINTAITSTTQISIDFKLKDILLKALVFQALQKRFLTATIWELAVGLPLLTPKWDMTKLSEIQVKHMFETKILTRQVLERFAKWDEENRVFRQQFESAYLNVFGTTTSTLQGNSDLVVDNCCNKRYAWKVDCNLMVEAFLGWFLIDKPARTAEYLTWSRLTIV